MARERSIQPAREVKSDTGDGERDLCELLDEIASELNLLRYDHLNPHALHERRDFLVRRLRRFARRLRGEPAAPAQPTTVYRGNGHIGPPMRSRPSVAETGAALFRRS